MRLWQARTLALIHRFDIFEICWFLTLRITAYAIVGWPWGWPFSVSCPLCYLRKGVWLSALRCHPLKTAHIALGTLVLLHSPCHWHRPLLYSLVRTLRGWKVSWLIFLIAIPSLASDTLHRTIAPCLRVTPGLLQRELLPPVFILLYSTIQQQRL